MKPNSSSSTAHNRFARLTDPQYQASLQSDAELVDLYALAGREDAMLALMDRYAAMIAGVIKRVVFHRQDAEDAFQATWLIFMKSAKRIRKRRSVSAWLYGVAYRTACRVRSKSRRLNTLEDLQVPDHQSDNDDAFSQLTRQIDLGNLDREMQLLPESLREPLFEFYILGLTAREIAQRMELSIAAVEGRLRRGRQALRQRLACRGASLSVCAAGVEWMQSHADVTQFATDASHAFATSPFLKSDEKLSEADSYLSEIVSGEQAMVTASATKSYGFWVTMSAVTATLTIVAVAAQLGDPSGATPPGVSSASGQRVQAVEAGEANASALKLAADPNGDPFNQSNATDPFAQEAAAAKSTAKPANNSSKSARPNTRGATNYSWLRIGREELERSEAIRDRLCERTEIDFAGLPLRIVLQTFQDKHGIDFVLIDSEDSDLGDVPVTLTLTDSTVRDALDIVLEAHSLSYEVHPNYVRIDKESNERQTLRKYDLSLLTKSPQEAMQLIQSLGAVTEIFDTGSVSVVGSTLIVNGHEFEHREIEKVLSVVPPAQ